VALSSRQDQSLQLFHSQLKLESHGIDMSNMEKQLETVKKDRDTMKVYLRQLEQKNDDLERAHRILNESIENFEKMLDQAYEKNALLELEVDEKGLLQEKLQRLMDETRGGCIYTRCPAQTLKLIHQIYCRSQTRAERQVTLYPSGQWNERSHGKRHKYGQQLDELVRLAAKWYCCQWRIGKTRQCCRHKSHQRQRQRPQWQFS